MTIEELTTDASYKSNMAYGDITFPFRHITDYFSQYKDNTLVWHWHTEFEFSFVVSGTVYCFIGKEKIELNVGQYLFINSGVIHKFYSPDKGVCRQIIFSTDFVSPRGSAVYEKNILPILESDCDYMLITGWDEEEIHIKELLAEAFREAERQDVMRELKVHIYVSTMWIAFYKYIIKKLRKIPAPRDTKSHEARTKLYIMLNYIHAHYMDPISLNDIAESAEISLASAVRYFRDLEESTPIRYLNDYRLIAAKSLLTETSDNITIISQKTGFDSSGYFSKSFRKKHGMSPSEYRQSCQKILSNSDQK